MSRDHPFGGALRRQVEFFRRTAACFDEADSTFAPAPDTYTVAAHVAHTALSIQWFLDGAFSDEGFDLDFEKEIAAAKAYTSLDAARKLLDEVTERGAAQLEATSMAEMQELLPEGPVMGGAPRLAIVEGMADHTAHHRGALAVYARLLQKVPAMPYAG